MKKIIICTAILMLPLVSWSQNETKFSQTIEEKGYTKIEFDFLPKMKTAAISLDKCSRINDKCNLTDPLKNIKTKYIKQIDLGISWGATQPNRVQKDMADFEKELTKNQKFPKTKIETAFSKYPGYSLEAMSSRMLLYIKSMESVDDDE